jgi:hypothetical protein
LQAAVAAAGLSGVVLLHVAAWLWIEAELGVFAAVFGLAVA